MLFNRVTFCYFLELQLLEWVFQHFKDKPLQKPCTIQLFQQLHFSWAYDYVYSVAFSLMRTTYDTERNAASIRISSRVSNHFFCFLNLKKVFRLCGVAIRDFGEFEKTHDHSPLFLRLVRFDGTPAILFCKGEGSLGSV